MSTIYIQFKVQHSLDKVSHYTQTIHTLYIHIVHHAQLIIGKYMKYSACCKKWTGGRLCKCWLSVWFIDTSFIKCMQLFEKRNSRQVLLRLHYRAGTVIVWQVPNSETYFAIWWMASNLHASMLWRSQLLSFRANSVTALAVWLHSDATWRQLWRYSAEQRSAAQSRLNELQLLICGYSRQPFPQTSPAQPRPDQPSTTKTLCLRWKLLSA